MKTLALVGLVVGLLPTASVAQVTQSYSYDGNGRLTGVSTTGSAGTNTAAYAYDDADNRTGRSRTGTSAYAALLNLPVDQPLEPHEALVSPDGRYSLALRSSGAVELRDTANTSGERSYAFADLFHVDSTGSAHFQQPLTVDKGEGAVVALNDEGDLVVLALDSAAVLWSAVSAKSSAVSQ